MARRYSLGITANNQVVECTARDLDDFWICKVNPTVRGKPSFWNFRVEHCVRQARGGVLLINEVCDVGGCTILCRLACVALEFGCIV
jgi:hypothetical protein